MICLIALMSACAMQQSPSPSPTPNPEVDVAAAFVEAMSGATSVHASVTGTLAIGEVTAQIQRKFESNGEDQRFLINVNIAGEPSQSDESLTVGGNTYRRSGGGVWLLEPRGGGAGTNPIAEALENSGSLENAGIEERDGERLHRLVFREPLNLAPAALGLTDSSIEDFEAVAEFFAEADGSPIAMVFTVTWSTSEAFGYAMAHPVDWDVTHIAETDDAAAYDFFLAPVSEEVDVYFYTGLTPDILANGWFRESAALLEQDFGVPVETNEEISVGGLSARLFSLHFAAPETLDKFYFQEAAVFGSGVAWDIDMYSEPGNEEADRELFHKFLSTFSPMGQSPTSVTEGANVWALQAGDCFSSLPLLAEPGQSAAFVGGVDGFASVDCAEAHTGEVISVWAEDEDADCERVFAEYVGRQIDGSQLALLMFLPVSVDNPPEGVAGLCVVADPSGAPGSARDSTR